MTDQLAEKSWVPTEVHDWKGKEKTVLVLNYTMACPLQCSFCCYSCNPKRKEKMDIALAKRLINEAGNLPDFSSVGFTGGEPLLFPKEITELSFECKNVGLPFTIATAGHWAKTSKHARAVLEPLAANGLIRLNLSSDPSHEAYIPRKSIINAANVALELDVDTFIVGTFADTEHTMEGYLPELADIPGIHMVTKYIAAVGRAASDAITQSTYGLSLNLDQLSCYRRVYHDLVVWHDGTVYPCCSTFNRDTPGIEVGNANDLSLKDLLTLTEGSLMLRVMKRKGFQRFYEIVKDIDPSLAKALPKVEDTVGPCSLCNGLLGDAKQAVQLKRVFETYEKRKTLNALSTIEERFGQQATRRLIQQVLEPELV